QVTDGVLVFHAVEPAHHHPRLRGLCRFRLPGNPFEQCLNVLFWRPRLRLRGHLAGLDPLQPRQPPLPVRVGREVRRELVEAEVALGFLSRVAFQTVPGEERPDLLVVSFVVWPFHVGRGSPVVILGTLGITCQEQDGRDERSGESQLNRFHGLRTPSAGWGAGRYLCGGGEEAGGGIRGGRRRFFVPDR